MYFKHSIVVASTIAAVAFRARAGAAHEIPVDPPTLRATVNLTIGSESDDRAEYQFGRINGLTFDAKGQIYVADATENNVRVFSDKGVYAFTIGQKGAGPGDFSGPGNISIANDGTLWIRESGNHRYSVIYPEPPRGKFVRVVAMKSNSGTWNRTHWDAGGHVVSLETAPTKPGQPFRSLRAFLDATGKVIATDTAPVVSPDSIEQWVIEVNGGISQNSKPFGMMRMEAFGGPGLAAYATNTVYAVNLVNAQGKRIALLTRSVPPVKPSAKELKRIDEIRETTAKNYGVPLSTLKLDVPKIKPVISLLGFDMDGRLWVQRGVIDGMPNEADVYSPEGKWVGIMQWPSNVFLLAFAIKGNTGLGVTTDGDAVQNVVRLSWK